MSATFNHTIIAAKDRAVSAAFYRDLLEAAEAPSWGFFTNLQLDGGVLLQFAEPPVEMLITASQLCLIRGRNAMKSAARGDGRPSASLRAWRCSTAAPGGRRSTSKSTCGTATRWPRS